MIRVEGLSKKFGAVQALSDVSFEAQDGRITGLLGHNGAGKSTTLRILSTVLRPDTGTRIVDGHDCVEQPLAGAPIARRAAACERLVRASHRPREHPLLRQAARACRARSSIGARTS